MTDKWLYSPKLSLWISLVALLWGAFWLWWLFFNVQMNSRQIEINRVQISKIDERLYDIESNQLLIIQRIDLLLKK